MLFKYICTLPPTYMVLAFYVKACKPQFCIACTAALSTRLMEKAAVVFAAVMFLG